MLVIEGIVVSVMETWPLQLVIQQGAIRYDVSLSESVDVKAGGVQVGVAVIRPGARVTVFGERRSGGSVVASTVLVRSPP